MHRYLAIAVAVTLALAGCASMQDTTSTAQKPTEEKEYRIGSRIPVKDPAAASSSPSATADPSAMRSGTPARTN